MNSSDDPAVARERAQLFPLADDEARLLLLLPEKIAAVAPSQAGGAA